jgi:hypothetical protein
MALTTDQLKYLSPESQKAFRQCFIENPASGEIRFTRKGFAKYGARFAKAGIDINQIRSRAALTEACSRSQWVFVEELFATVKGSRELEDILKLHFRRPD